MDGRKHSGVTVSPKARSIEPPPNIGSAFVPKKIRSQEEWQHLATWPHYLPTYTPTRLHIVYRKRNREYDLRTWDLHQGRISPASYEEYWGVLDRLGTDTFAQEWQVALFGRMHSNCMVCGKQLTDPESMQRGIGPKCEGRLVTPITAAA